MSKDFSEINNTINKVKLNIKQKPNQVKVEVQSRLLTEVEKDFFREKFKIADSKKIGKCVVTCGMILALIMLVISVIMIKDMPKAQANGYIIANVIAILTLLGFCLGIGAWLMKPGNIDNWIIFETTVLEVSDHIQKETGKTAYRYITVEWPFAEEKTAKIKSEETYNYSVYDRVYVVCTKLNEHENPVSIYSEIYPLNYRSVKGDKIS